MTKQNLKQTIEQIKSLYQSITVFEIVLTTVVAVGLGVAFWGWTFVYEIAKPFLKIYGLKYVTAGFWIFSSVFLSQIVRKPGIAILASVFAAFVESLLTRWGIMSVTWGLVQGLGAELIFLSTGYQQWNLRVLILASSLATLFSYGLDVAFNAYYNLSLGFNLIQLSSYLVSSALLAAWLSQVVAGRLVRIGLLDQFLIAKSKK